MRWLKLKILVLVLLIIFLIPSSVLADTTQDVTVTATGWILAQPPTGLTLTYISDYEVGISWTKGVDAENTMVRGAVGRVPENISDGYLVYEGPGTSCSDTGVSLDETAAPVYYIAFSQDVHGSWESEGISDFIEGIGMLMIAFVVLALGLFAMSWIFKKTPLAFAAGLAWIGFGVYSISRASESGDLYHLFGWLGIALSLSCFLQPWFFRERAKPLARLSETEEMTSEYNSMVRDIRSMRAGMRSGIKTKSNRRAKRFRELGEE